MADEFKLKLDSKEINRLLTKASNRMNDLKPVLTDIGDRIKANTKLRFDQGVGPDGKKWKELSEITKILRREGPGSGGDKPLNDTRALFGSIQKAVGKDNVSIGSNLPYAAIQQFGGTIRPKNKNFLAFGSGKTSVFAKKSVIPARPYLGINKDDELDISDIIEEHLREAFNG